MADSELTTGAVMQRLDPSERYAFVAGVVEGLAYARYLQDGKTPAGMRCIYDWFYRTPGSLDQVYVAFGEFPEYPPGAVMAVVLKQVCG